MEQKTVQRSIIKRIKWKSVALVIFLVAIAFLIILGFNPFLSYKGSGEIKIRSWAEPNKVSLDGKSTIWVEVKNQGSENKRVFISLKSYDPVIKFFETNSQEENKTIFIGKGESRKLDFKIQISASYAGDYGVSIKAKYDKETIEDEVYISVVK
ncbi:MAG: hypothetical protein QXY62_03800 [Candidatus Altiarchaeota archaeon]